MITREIQLAARITGIPAPEHFTVAKTEVDGEVLVRTDQVGLAATYLELMRADCTIPVPAWEPGQRVGVATIGTVVRSDSPELAVGDLVQSMTGWSEYSAGPAAGYVKLDRGLFADPGHHLGQGPTAYYGMADVAGVGEGDVVFVSGAAGGVGSLAGQIARCLGAARVIGSAGSPEKVDYLVNELGYDAAFDYHDGSPADRLRSSRPTASRCSSTSWAASSTTPRCGRPGPARGSRCAARCRASSATRRSASRSPTRRRPRPGA